MDNRCCDQEGKECGEVPAVETEGPTCPPRLTERRDSFTLFTEGDMLYEAMLASIASARHSIRLESHIFADDEVGRRFAGALAERARAGVEIRLHIDAAGSLFWGPRSLERHLREQGGRAMVSPLELEGAPPLQPAQPPQGDGGGRRAGLSRRF